jgi:acyl-CoA synthetase (AMP-forming)/AMP-acid ligase II
LTREVVRDGWFVTGDIGLIDDRGLLYLRGREREEINRGGLKVYPGDVDAVLEVCDGVLDVCTFGYEDPIHGESVGVAVVLGSRDDETLRASYRWVTQRLAKHQIPSRWYVLSDIPRTSRGKVNRATVAARCSGVPAVDLQALLRSTGAADVS